MLLDKLRGAVINAGGEGSALSDRDGNFLRDHRRIERKVVGVAEHELKRVLARWKLDARFGLACAKMKVRFVLRKRLIGIERLIHVDQEVMMSAVRVAVAGVGHAHVAQAKAAPEPTFDGEAVLRPYEIKQHILRRGLSLSMCGEGQASERR